MTRKEKAEKKAIEQRIDLAYRRSCDRIQISVLDIGKVFEVGRKAIAEGVDDAELEKRIRAFVETIRKN
jgi:hypothetical protein